MDPVETHTPCGQDESTCSPELIPDGLTTLSSNLCASSEAGMASLDSCPIQRRGNSSRDTRITVDVPSPHSYQFYLEILAI